MMKRLPIPLAIAVLVAVLLANRFVLLDLTDIRSREVIPAGAPLLESVPRDRTVVRIGVVSRFAPNVIFAGYQPVMDYLTEHGSHRYELHLSTSYQDAVDHLRQGRVEASFLGAWIFGHAGTDGDLLPIVAPLNDAGVSSFHTVLVTGPDSDVASVSDLAGKRVALPSAQSWSGNWLQSSALPSVGLSTADLDTVHHFDHHQTVVWQVLRGEFDAGVVKESVAAEFSSEGLRSVAWSLPIPGPPLVGHRRVPRRVLQEIRSLLLALDAGDPHDRAVIDTWTPEFSFGFVDVDRRQYEKAFLNRESKP